MKRQKKNTHTKCSIPASFVCTRISFYCVPSSCLLSCDWKPCCIMFVLCFHICVWFGIGCIVYIFYLYMRCFVLCVWNKRLTYCRARYPVSICDRRAHAAFEPHHTPSVPSAACNHTTTEYWAETSIVFQQHVAAATSSNKTKQKSRKSRNGMRNKRVKIYVLFVLELFIENIPELRIFAFIWSYRLAQDSFRFIPNELEWKYEEWR